ATARAGEPKQKRARKSRSSPSPSASIQAPVGKAGAPSARVAPDPAHCIRVVRDGDDGRALAVLARRTHPGRVQTREEDAVFGRPEARTTRVTVLDPRHDTIERAWLDLRDAERSPVILVGRSIGRAGVD